MARNKPVFPETSMSDKRQENKAKRGFGKRAMDKVGASPAEWAQKSDPLFKVRGITRHKKIKGIV